MFLCNITAAIVSLVMEVLDLLFASCFEKEFFSVFDSSFWQTCDVTKLLYSKKGKNKKAKENIGLCHFRCPTSKRQKLWTTCNFCWTLVSDEKRVEAIKPPSEEARYLRPSRLNRMFRSSVCNYGFASRSSSVTISNRRQVIIVLVLRLRPIRQV